MAIVTTKGLEGDQAAYAPCILSGTASRDNFTSGGVLIENAITVWGSGTGGRLTIQFASGGANYDNDDTVTISGATGDLAKYNGRHEVYTLSATTLTMTTLWDGGTTAAVGKVTRTNDSIQVRGDVYEGATLKVSVYTQPASKVFSMDFARALQSLLSSIFTLTAGAAATTGAAKAYTIKLFEQWQRADYSTRQEESSGYEQTGVAHRTSSTAVFSGGAAALGSNYLAGGKVFFHVISANTDPVRIDFTAYPIAGGSPTVTNVAVTLVNKHAAAVYAIPAGMRYVTAALVATDSGTPISGSLITIRTLYGCGKRLYFLNRLGGYTSIEFTEVESYTDAVKVDRYAVRSYDEQKLQSVLEARDYAAYFRDLADSAEIYDETGKAVELETSTIQYYGNDPIAITVTTKYEQDYIS
jgi:hypothetical protein